MARRKVGCQCDCGDPFDLPSPLSGLFVDCLWRLLQLSWALRTLERCT